MFFGIASTSESLSWQMVTAGQAMAGYAQVSELSDWGDVSRRMVVSDDDHVIKLALAAAKNIRCTGIRITGWQRSVPVLTERSSEAGNQFQRRFEQRITRCRKGIANGHVVGFG